MILMYRTWVFGIPLKVFIVVNLNFHFVFKAQHFSRVKLLLLHLAKAYCYALDLSPPWD